MAKARLYPERMDLPAIHGKILSELTVVSRLVDGCYPYGEIRPHVQALQLLCHELRQRGEQLSLTEPAKSPVRWR